MMECSQLSKERHIRQRKITTMTEKEKRQNIYLNKFRKIFLRLQEFKLEIFKILKFDIYLKYECSFISKRNCNLA